MTHFLCLTPVRPYDFGLNVAEFIKETKDHYNCGTLPGPMINGHASLYITGKKEPLEYLCADIQLNGIVVEYIGVYDQVEDTI